MSTPTHFATIRRDRAGGWRYRVFSGTRYAGEKIDTSESYTRRASALRAVKRNRPDVSGVHIYNRADTKVVRVISLGGGAS